MFRLVDVHVVTTRSSLGRLWESELDDTVEDAPDVVTRKKADMVLVAIIY